MSEDRDLIVAPERPLPAVLPESARAAAREAAQNVIRIGGEDVTHLMDPIKAEMDEAARYAAAPRRRRYSADDLDREMGR